MKLSFKCRKWISIVVIAAAIVTAIGVDRFSTVSYAYTQTSGTIKGAAVRVRDSASTSGGIITKLDNGTAVTVIDQTTTAGEVWYQISFTNNGAPATGWVRYDLINVGASGTEAPPVDTSVSGTTGTIVGTGINVRSGPGTSYSKVTKVNSGQSVSILGQNNASGTIWYQVSFSIGAASYTGWIIQNYITMNNGASTENVGASPDDAGYIAALQSAGFPASYCNYLLALHKQYPSWQFEAVQTGLDWNTVIENESKLGVNLVQASSNDACKSTQSGAYDWTNNRWYGLDGAGWVNASSEMIAYSMDPRNYLDATNIFQFATNEYQTYQNTAGVSSLLNGTFMAGNYNDTDGAVRNYSETFTTVGANLGVSPYHLASRCRQEQGTKGTSGSISGTVAGYENLFNYFNINAYAKNGNNATINGLIHARSQGWNTRYASIQGGAAVVANRYVKIGQNTVYFEKFNVVTTSLNKYSHQYMTNVEAATSEGKSMSKAYTDLGQALLFRIPVYSGMPDAVCARPSSGNPNNWLRSLSVAGYNITPSFSGGNTTYSMIVGESVSSVSISADAVAATSSVSGTGTIGLNYGSNAVSVVCTAQNGTQRAYNINIVRQGGGSGTYTRGDVSGDGKITLLDLAHIKRQLLGISPLEGAQFTAADINGDGKITLLDYAMVKRHLLGIESIQ